MLMLSTQNNSMLLLYLAPNPVFEAIRVCKYIVIMPIGGLIMLNIICNLWMTMLSAMCEAPICQNMQTLSQHVYSKDEDRRLL